MLPIVSILTLVPLLSAEVIDRIAVTVGNRVITESMVISEIRLAAFQDGKEPDFSPAAKRAAAERLVDRMLLIQEMDDSRYPEPAMADILEQIAGFRKQQFPSEEAFRTELARRFLDETELRQYFQLQHRILQFIEVRFRTGVQVSSEEIAAYFDTQVKPQFVKEGRPAPSLDDVSEKIEEVLTSKRVDAATEEWLKQSRALARIRFRAEVFR
jgi:hypothetical protein